MNDLLSFTEAAMARELAGQTTGDPSDAPRLSGQLLAVYRAMLDGNWHTLEELAAIANGSTQSVSARLRDLRKPLGGSHTIERQKVSNSGLYRYRMVA